MIEFTVLHLFFLITLGLCCRALIQTVKQPVPIFTNGDYSRTALRIGRFYKIAAYGMLTFSFFIGLVISTYHLVVEL